MISVFAWKSSTGKGRWGDAKLLEGRTGREISEDEVLWIDLEDPTAQEEALVFQSFLPVHPLILEDITRLYRMPEEPPHLPKVEEFRDHLFVVVNPLDPRRSVLLPTQTEPVNETQPLTTQLSAILTRQVLITHHYDELASIEALHSYLLRHPSHAERRPDYLFHLVLDAMVDQYAPILDTMEEALDHIEADLFLQPTYQLLLQLVQLKRIILQLRKTLVHERELLARLCRGEFTLINPQEMVYYRNVFDHLVRFADLIESSREMVSDLLQMHLAVTSNRLNEVMKVLTMISTAILPMTLVAGIYGMNFKKWFPELDWEYGYVWALALMSALGLGALSFFRWKKWI